MKINKFKKYSILAGFALLIGLSPIAFAKVDDSKLKSKQAEATEASQVLDSYFLGEKPLDKITKKQLVFMHKMKVYFLLHSKSILNLNNDFANKRQVLDLKVKQVYSEAY
jgi:hypothetical protein